MNGGQNSDNTDLMVSKKSIVITAPSLNVTENVSGISSIVRTIIDHNKVYTYRHVVMGSPDRGRQPGQRLRQLFAGYRRLHQVLKNEGVALVHLNLPLNKKALLRDALSFFICRYHRKKVLLHLHGGSLMLNKKLSHILTVAVRFLLRKANAVICLSTVEQQFLTSTFGAKKVVVLPNTVKVNSNIDARCYDAKRRLVVLFMGRLHASKGIEAIATAIDILHKRSHASSIHFTFCGAGPLEKVVAKLAKDKPEMVSYQGVVDGAAKQRVFEGADVILLPSTYGEGLPVTLLEGMANGLVPIVTSDGSIDQVVTDQKSGIVVAKYDAMAIAAAMEALVNDTAMFNRLSKGALETLAKMPSLNEYIHKLNMVYVEVLNKGMICRNNFTKHQ